MKKTVRYLIVLLVLVGSTWTLSLQQAPAHAAPNGSPAGGTSASCEICKKVLMGRSCKAVKDDEQGTTKCKDEYVGRGVVNCKPKGETCGGPSTSAGSGGVVMF